MDGMTINHIVCIDHGSYRDLMGYTQYGVIIAVASSEIHS
jgi:hypothetical protein